jgi:hypothetical protein
MSSPSELLQTLNALDGRITNLEDDISRLKSIETSLSFFHLNLEFFKGIANRLDPRLVYIENNINTVIPDNIARQAETTKYETINAATRQVQDTLRGELDTLRHSIDGFRHDAKALWATKAEVEQAKLTQALQPHANSSKPKVPSPTAFSGKRDDWKTFSSHLTLFFTVNESQYPTDTDKILFAISRLGEGSAFKYMEQFIPDFKKPAAARPMIISSYDTFLKTMSENFGVQNAHIVAEAQLRSLKQKGSAMDYTNKFVELASDTNWNDSAKISQYRIGLKDAVQDMIALAEEPTGFSAFTTLAINIDKRQYARYVEKQHGSNTTRPASTTTPSSHRNSPPMPRSAPLSTQAQSSASSQPPPSMAMDLSQARHLSPEEKKRRQEQNLCFYCGHPDHLSKNCPNKTSKTALANAAVGDYSDTDFVSFDLGKANA